ncbi:MAG: hypothetical protein ACRD2H_08795 [Terriglobales bacterium]
MAFLWTFVVLFILWIIGLSVHWAAVAVWILFVLWIIFLIVFFARGRGHGPAPPHATRP